MRLYYTRVAVGSSRSQQENHFFRVPLHLLTHTLLLFLARACTLYSFGSQEVPDKAALQARVKAWGTDTRGFWFDGLWVCPFLPVSCYFMLFMFLQSHPNTSIFEHPPNTSSFLQFLQKCGFAWFEWKNTSLARGSLAPCFGWAQSNTS